MKYAFFTLHSYLFILYSSFILYTFSKALLHQTVLSLPMHTEMTREMLEYVCKALIESIDHSP